MVLNCSGVALDDLREGLRRLESELSDTTSEVFAMRYDGLDGRLANAAADCARLADQVRAAMASAGDIALQQVRLVSSDLEESLECEPLGLRLARPSGSAWVGVSLEAGLGGLCPSEDEDEGNDGQPATRGKRRKRLNELDSSSDEGAAAGDSDQDSSIAEIKRRAGKDPDRLAASFAFTEEEEARTASNTCPTFDCGDADAPASWDEDFNARGKASEAKGRWDSAIMWHERDLEATAKGDHLGKSLVLRNLGVCYRELDGSGSNEAHRPAVDRSLVYLNAALDEARLFGGEPKSRGEAEVERCLTELGNHAMERASAAGGPAAADYVRLALARYKEADALARSLLAADGGSGGGGGGGGSKVEAGCAERLDAAARASYNYGRALFDACTASSNRGETEAATEAVRYIRDAVDMSGRIPDSRGQDDDPAAQERRQLQLTYWSALGDALGFLGRTKDAMEAVQMALCIERSRSERPATSMGEERGPDELFEGWAEGKLLFQAAATSIEELSSFPSFSAPDAVPGFSEVVFEANKHIDELQVAAERAERPRVVATVRDLKREMRHALSRRLLCAPARGEEGAIRPVDPGPSSGALLKQSAAVHHRSFVVVAAAAPRGFMAIGSDVASRASTRAELQRRAGIPAQRRTAPAQPTPTAVEGRVIIGAKDAQVSCAWQLPPPLGLRVSWPTGGLKIAAVRRHHEAWLLPMSGEARQPQSPQSRFNFSSN